MSPHEEANYFVAPNGNDRWSGKLPEPNRQGSDGPFSSLALAQEAIREHKKERQGPVGPVVVQIRGGTYFLDSPLCFGLEDSGTVESPIIYKAYPGEHPVISGGVSIKGWQRTDNGWWQVKLGEVHSGQWSFSQLFVNGHRRHRPRLPSRGYYCFAEEVPPSEAAAGKGFDRFKFNKGNLCRNWHNLPDVEVLCFHFWEMSRMHLAEVDETKHIARLTGPTCSTEYWAGLYKGSRFIVENVREALAEPGQWYLDRASGVLTYIPMPGEDIETAEVIAPRTRQLLLINGDMKGHCWVQFVRFEGLTFSHTNWTTPEQGHSCPQAEISVQAAIHAEGARHCDLIDCTISHVGEYAIQWSRGCRHNSVRRCRMTDLGAGGVKLGRSYQADQLYDEDDEEALASHQTVCDCLIAHVGRIHPGAVGIWIGHSPNNRVEHNEITDLYYTGISVGWVWGYGQSQAHHNTIACNHISHVGQNVLDDMGAIYALGVSPGTVIRCNHVHDVNAFAYGGSGVYFDQGASQITAVDNVCYRCNGQPFHQHYGRDNRVRNNIFACGGLSQFVRSKEEPHCSFLFERNIVYWKSKAPLFRLIRETDRMEKGCQIDCNLYWNAAGHPILCHEDTFEQWQRKGQDRHSVVADPMFIDPDNDNYGLKSGSPAEKIGFQSIDITLACQGEGKDKHTIVGPAEPAFPTDFSIDDFRAVMDKRFDVAGPVPEE